MTRYSYICRQQGAEECSAKVKKSTYVPSVKTGGSTQTTETMSKKRNLLLLLLVYVLFLSPAKAQTKCFEANDKDLVNYEVPEWYADAKVGYWAIYGLYSIPAFGSEWYGRFMYYTKDGANKNQKNVPFGMRISDAHRKKYGNPKEFGYKDFIPMFKSEKFNADEWLDFCVEGGGKFFTMIGIFHDNFCMYDSEVNPFNSMDMGPKRDFVAELRKATRKRGLHFGLSNHSAWNGTFFQFNKANGFDASPETLWLYGSGKVDEAAVDRWWRQTTEMADKYQPDLYYFDWCWNMSPLFEQRRRDFLAYYYNAALKWNDAKYPAPGVVVNYKNRKRLPAGSAVLDLERGGMTDIEEHIWQNDTSIGEISWSYVPDERFRSANQVVDMLVDIVSKNGVLMLAFGPKADGSIPEEAHSTIGGMGAWLKTNGEAIYATRPWSVYGEGPTVPNPKMHGDQVDYVAEDVRFTRSKDLRTLYATFLAYPGDKATIRTLKSDAISLETLRSVDLIDGGECVKWTQDAEGLHLALPASLDRNEHAYALKLSFEGEIPSLRVKP